MKVYLLKILTLFMFLGACQKLEDNLGGKTQPSLLKSVETITLVEENGFKLLGVKKESGGIWGMPLQIIDVASGNSILPQSRGVSLTITHLLDDKDFTFQMAEMLVPNPDGSGSPKWIITPSVPYQFFAFLQSMSPSSYKAELKIKTAKIVTTFNLSESHLINREDRILGGVIKLKTEGANQYLMNYIFKDDGEELFCDTRNIEVQTTNTNVEYVLRSASEIQNTCANSAFANSDGKLMFLTDGGSLVTTLFNKLSHSLIHSSLSINQSASYCRAEDLSVGQQRLDSYIQMLDEHIALSVSTDQKSLEVIDLRSSRSLSIKPMSQPIINIELLYRTLKSPNVAGKPLARFLVGVQPEPLHITHTDALVKFYYAAEVTLEDRSKYTLGIMATLPSEKEPLVRDKRILSDGATSPAIQFEELPSFAKKLSDQRVGHDLASLKAAGFGDAINSKLNSYAECYPTTLYANYFCDTGGGALELLTLKKQEATVRHLPCKDEATASDKFIWYR